MKITIELLSDLCAYSGETYNSTVDADVLHDVNGIPYISAKRLKGCIREAALELCDFNIISNSEFDEIFGREGDLNSAFSISNAYIENYEKEVACLQTKEIKRIATTENVLEQYSYTRTQTAVDLKTGVAEENSLRTTRVIKKGLTFEAECNWNRKVTNTAALKEAISLVKHIGMSRTRGLGLVNMRLDENYSKESKHLLVDKNSYDFNKIRYTITLKSPMICKSAQGNQAVTEDFIAASKILGLIAAKMSKDDYQNLTKSEFAISNAYIMHNNNRCYPASISLQKEKDKSFLDNKMTVYNMIVDDGNVVSGRQMTSANISYIDIQDMTAMDVLTEISYHHQRPEDKSIGKATGKDGSSFYQLGSISSGQKFAGYIYATKEQTEKILSVIDQMGEVRMGYGKNSEFGAVEFQIDQISEYVNPKKITKDVMLVLASDLLIYNDKAMLTTDINDLKEVLANELNMNAADFTIENPFLNYVVVGGYNVSWGCRKPISYAFGKGSSFRLKSNYEFDLSVLNDKFIGERVTEGFGELRVVETDLQSQKIVTLRKNSDQNEKQQEDILKSEVVNGLLRKELNRYIDIQILNSMTSVQEVFSKGAGELNPVISKLRLIYKNEESYEKLKEQVSSIEKTSKKEIAEKLVNAVEPEKIVELAVNSLKEEYPKLKIVDQFYQRLKQDENYRQKFYKLVYRSYLTELKYQVKRMK